MSIDENCDRSLPTRENLDPVAHVSFHGKQFYISHSDPDDHLYRIVSQGSFYEVELLTALLPYLHKGDVVFDVGANIGNHTVFFAGVAEATVVAFEPDSEAFHLLARNVKLNGLESRVQLLQKGISSAHLTGSLVAQQSHNLGSASFRAGGGDVHAAPLDSIPRLPRPALIKIDTEGMDLEVLKGARRTIRKYKPMICVEAKTVAEYDEIFRYMRGMGYLLGGSFNFSATHMFLPAARFQTFGVVSALSRFAGEFFIRTEAEQERLRRRIARVEEISAEHKASIATLVEAESARELDHEAVLALAAKRGELLRVLTGLPIVLHGTTGLEKIADAMLLAGARAICDSSGCEKVVDTQVRCE